MDSIWFDLDFPTNQQTGDGLDFGFKNEDPPLLEVSLLIPAVQKAPIACSRDECGKSKSIGFEPPAMFGDFDAF